MKIGGIVCIVFIACICMLFLEPYYHHRVRLHNIHKELLDIGICQHGKGSVAEALERVGDPNAERFKRINIELVKYEGVSTNCGTSNDYVKQSIYLGTILDFWEESPLRKFITADDWRLQIAFFSLASITVCCGWYFLYRYVIHMEWIDRMSSATTSLVPRLTYPQKSHRNHKPYMNNTGIKELSNGYDDE